VQNTFRHVFSPKVQNPKETANNKIFIAAFQVTQVGLWKTRA
jgi:heme-binding NEAT domain protein